MTETDPLRTVAETGEQLRVASITLARWRAAGTGPNYTKVGRKVLYRQSEIDAFITARNVGAPVAARG